MLSSNKNSPDLLTDMFGRYAREFFSPYLDSEDKGFNPNIEVKETTKGYQVLAELPGMNESDINVFLKDNCLVIEGTKENSTKQESLKGYYRTEFSYGKFSRSVPLQIDVDDKNIEATYMNGILEIDLIKREDGIDRTRKISINKNKSH